MLTPLKSYSKSTMLLRAKPRVRGFTLIELLMVMAIIAILASITFGIFNGVKNAQARAKAKSELAVLSQAIEQFKSRYGDYPWLDSSGSTTNQMLLFALTGRMTMQVDSNGKMVVDAPTSDQKNSSVLKRPKFIDDTKFNTEKDSNGNSLELLDPWGNPYIYKYKSVDAEKTGPVWDVFGFHLYSTGPKGEDANAAIKDKINPTTGVISVDFRAVADAQGIIFAGE